LGFPNQLDSSNNLECFQSIKASRIFGTTKELRLFLERLALEPTGGIARCRWETN
jgi:hypothetical protein